VAPCSAILDGLLAGIVEQFRDVFGPVVFEIQSLRLVDMPQPQLTSTNLNQPQATSSNLNQPQPQPQATSSCWSSGPTFTQKNPGSHGTEDVPNGGGLHDAALLMSWWKVGIKLVDLNSSALTFQQHRKISMDIHYPWIIWSFPKS